jgi:alpha-mannosidase
MSHAVRFTARKIAQRLRLIEPLVYRRRAALAPWHYRRLDAAAASAPVTLDDDTRTWPRVPPEIYWGAPFTGFVLRGGFAVPEDWPADAPVALWLPLGDDTAPGHPEALVYVDGAPYAGCDRHHREMALPATWRDGRPHDLALHGWIDNLHHWLERGSGARRAFMGACALVSIDQPTRDFVAAARVALGVAGQLASHDPARSRLLNALDEAFKRLDTREPLDEQFYASVPEAHAVLRERTAQAGAPLPVTLVAAGHAHIDVAWLWTLGQARRKAERTFASALRLMEQFPDFHFTQSQPQLYDFVREDQPALFKQIRQRVAEGRWEPIGGMWVEADCNLTGAESLARQFVLGQRFFREQFGAGAASPVLWLPDVFGYAWNLPQLARQAGMQYFFTIKISWNQYNRMPADTFWWQGLDGTRILTHFSPTPEPGTRASTYNAAATPEDVLHTWTNFQQPELAGRDAGDAAPLLMSYGYGDGGGGPTREMLENLRELRAFPAAPQVRAGRAGEFFRELEARAGERLPVWNGELYLEYHRGTYTTQSRIKRANRKNEFLLHDAEFLAAYAAQLDADYRYPAGELQRAWQLLCLNQFHDILPGSSIHDVYVEAEQQHAAIAALGKNARAGALAAIAAQVGGDLLLANPTGFTRRDLAFWPGALPPGAGLLDAGGRPVHAQAVEDGVLLDAGELPPYSVTPLRRAPAPSGPLRGSRADADSAAPDSELLVAPEALENACLRVEFDAAGDITRIYDKTNQREVLPAGARANQFQIFEDRPLAWDAWDVDPFYDDRCWTAEPAEWVQVAERGPLRAALELRRRVLRSTITQRISLARGSARLDFEAVVDWRERHVLLKVAFPVEVLAPVATHEIQWGNVERPTHHNTSWDWARFETCAHKWVDLSEGDYGVSLLNDCKYGHDVRDNVMRLSLLRSPTSPDPEADQGEQRFSYSLLPHAGRWDARTIAAAYALNDPLIAWTGSGRVGERPAPPPLIAVDRPNVAIETVKQAEDGRGVIVRLYECQRRRGPLTLTAGFALAAAQRTDLLEQPQEDLAVDGRRVRLAVRPYEIVTLRLIPA